MRLLSPAAVHVAVDSRARLDLARADARLRAEGWPGLAEVLYAATGRPPRNLRGEAAVLGARAVEVAAALGDRHAGAAARFLRTTAERLAQCHGEFFEMARSGGLSKLEEELDVVARCIELAERNGDLLGLGRTLLRAYSHSQLGFQVGRDEYVTTV